MLEHPDDGRASCGATTRFRISASYLSGLVLALLFLLSPAHAQSSSTCEALAGLTLPRVITIVAREVPAGLFKIFGFSGDLPAFCHVTLVVEPQINIEVWLPKEAWNKRFRAEGGGGYVGIVNYKDLADALRAGYATASTDTGHQFYAGGAFALKTDGSLNRQLITDFASRSLHELALKSKSLIKAYYGVQPRYSYWRGCSSGGREGLMAIQRFPEEYDGVLAGCPAINWDRFIPSTLWPQVVMRQEVGHPIDATKLEAVTQAAVAACDSDDGVADGLITNPRKCRYDPSASECKGDDDTTPCLTVHEANAVRKIWQGPTSTGAGQRLWFGLERGAPLSRLAAGQPFSIGWDHFQYWIKQDPSFDWRKLTEADFERAIRDSHSKFNDVIGTDEPNMRRFAEHGGKLLIWHGESDEVIFPRGTLNYFERVLAANGGPKNVAKFARLYMLPGFGHACEANDKAPFPEGMFEALVHWVESGVAPDRILASQKLPTGSTRTRPLCAYPKTARWTGRGSSDDATNFSCEDGGHDLDDFHVVDLDAE